MGTRAYIGIENKDGTVRAVYAHWDNYLEGTGDILVNHYTDVKKINELLDLGDMSSIGTEPIGIWGEGPREYCQTYRMRGEDDVDARTFSSVEKFLDYADEDYTYLFKDGRWLFRCWDDRDLLDVKEELAKLN